MEMVLSVQRRRRLESLENTGGYVTKLLPPLIMIINGGLSLYQFLLNPYTEPVTRVLEDERKQTDLIRVGLNPNPFAYPHK